MHFCLNDTSTYDDGTLIPGGQLDRYMRPMWQALDELGVEYTVGRQPRLGVVNVYPNHRDAYKPGSWYGEHASVQISHGLASKGYRNAERCSDFTAIAAPGPALAEEIIASGISRDRVHICGYAKLDPIYRGEVASPWPERDGRIRVLWAPTHGGGSERHQQGNPDAPGAGATTWWHRDALLKLLDPERFLVMEAPHPRHHPQRQATLAEYVGADVVLADGGSTMYEAWCVGLPVVFPDWLTAHRNLTRANGSLLEARVYRERIGWHADRPKRYADTVRAAAEAGISAGEAAFAEEVLPLELRGRGGRLHAELFMRLADAPPVTTYRVIGHGAHATVTTPSGGRARQLFFRGAYLQGIPDHEVQHLLSMGLIEPVPTTDLVTTEA